jgi:hypothetical protein
MNLAANDPAPSHAHLIDLARELRRPLRRGWLPAPVVDVVLILAADRSGIAGDRLAETAAALGEIMRGARH